MPDPHDPWNIPQRKAQVMTALTTLVERGHVRPDHVAEIEALYARGLLFEAERVAGLAIWLATSPPHALLHELPVRLGALIEAWHSLGTRLATMDQWELWRPYAQSLDAFQRTLLQVSPPFYARLVQLARIPATSATLPLTEQGQALQRVLTMLTTSDTFSRGPAILVEWAAHRSLTLDDLRTRAQQIAEHMLWLGRTLRSIRLWELWAEQAPSYAAFLETVLGINAPIAAGLVGWAATWDATPHPRMTLGTLETAVHVAMGHTRRTTTSQRTGGVR